MDQAPPIILSVSTPSYGQAVIDASDGVRYTSDLSRLAAVHCYPKDFEQWRDVFIDSDGLALVWGCRFEVHVDQILSNVIRKETKSTSEAAIR